MTCTYCSTYGCSSISSGNVLLSGRNSNKTMTEHENSLETPNAIALSEEHPKVCKKIWVICYGNVHCMSDTFCFMMVGFSLLSLSTLTKHFSSKQKDKYK